jgi:hypothetical protein
MDTLPQKSTAFVDFDTKDGAIPVPELFSLARVIGITPESVCYKRTRRGWHLAVRFLETFSRIELIALQCILGDDPMRGALNLMRERQMKKVKAGKYWQSRSNILYSKKL